MTNTPLMELKESKMYDITYNGINTYLQAKTLKRYKDRYELYRIYSNKKDNSANEKIWADKGILKNNILSLFGNVFYKDNTDQTLFSNTVIYNLKKDILSSDTPFKATYKKSKVTGSSFIYYKREKKLVAQNIKANILTEDFKK